MVSSETIFEGRVFSVCVDRALLPDGRKARREVVLHSGGASVVALDSGGYVYLVRQWRYPFASAMLEIPAGKLEDGEDPAHCAVRELREETGMAAGQLISLGDHYPTPAYCSEVLRIYLALDLVHVGQRLDDGEFLEAVKIPFEEAFLMVIRGELRDAKTQIGLLKTWHWLKNKEKMEPFSFCTVK